MATYIASIDRKGYAPNRYCYAVWVDPNKSWIKKRFFVTPQNRSEKRTKEDSESILPLPGDKITLTNDGEKSKNGTLLAVNWSITERKRSCMTKDQRRRQQASTPVSRGNLRQREKNKLRRKNW